MPDVRTAVVVGNPKPASRTLTAALHLHRELVAARRVQLVRLRADLLAQSISVRGAGVVEDQLLVQVLQVAHAPLRKKSMAPATPSITASTSASVV